MGKEANIQKAKEVREGILELAKDYIDATHIEVGQITAKDDVRALVTIRVSDANRYAPYQGHDTSEFTVGDYWMVNFDDLGIVRLLSWVSNAAGGGTVPLPPITAADVANVPAGGIAATDVQGAINELDTEKEGPHDILDGAVHTDSVADAVTRGSLIYGNSTPKWDELPIGAAGRILTSDGVDPSWAAPGGGVAAHNILDGGVVHLDSALDAVTRGSIIVGNSHPNWDELVIGAAGRVLTSDGVDAGWAAVPGAGVDEGQYGNNLVKNSPGQIITDGVEPQWWDDTVDATITDEDTAGEGIVDKHERCFKVVTTGDDQEGYQVLTFADEELLDAGQTVVSFGCWVYSAAANEASIAIMGVNLGVQESAQHTGGASWEWLTVENITLNAADASISLYLRVDTGTAYFTMPMLCVGVAALPWKPRAIKYIAISMVNQIELVATGDVAWTDTDCTVNSDNLAVGISGQIRMREPNGVLESWFDVAHDSAIQGGDGGTVWVTVIVLGKMSEGSFTFWRCDDSQVLRYRVEEKDADNDVYVAFYINGYWMWE